MFGLVASFHLCRLQSNWIRTKGVSVPASTSLYRPFLCGRDSSSVFLVIPLWLRCSASKRRNGSQGIKQIATKITFSYLTHCVWCFLDKTESMPCLSQTSCFVLFLPGHAYKSKWDRPLLTFRFLLFIVSLFPFPLVLPFCCSCWPFTGLV